LKLESSVRYDDPNVAISAVIGIISAILLFVIVVVLQAFFYGAQQTEMEKKVLTRPNQALQQLNASQQELLGSYGWLSEGDGVVRIPIERAMELVAAESQ
jgi:flagellar basal body-associated protein FliL